MQANAVDRRVHLENALALKIARPETRHKRRDGRVKGLLSLLALRGASTEPLLNTDGHHAVEDYSGTAILAFLKRLPFLKIHYWASYALLPQQVGSRGTCQMQMPDGKCICQYIYIFKGTPVSRE